MHVRRGRIGKLLLEQPYAEFFHSVAGDEVFVQDPECSLKILRRLREGGIVQIYFDLDSSHATARLPFPGGWHRFAAGFLEIVRVSRCALIPMLCLGNSRRLRIVFDAPLDLNYDLDRLEFVGACIPGLARMLQAQVVEHPDQWELFIRTAEPLDYRADCSAGRGFNRIPGGAGTETILS